MPRITSVKQRQLVAASPDNTKEQFQSRRIFNIGTGFGGLIECITLQTDGKFLVGGTITLFNGESIGSRFTRLNADGTLDTEFNTNLGTGFNGSMLDIKQQADGKILVAGSFFTFNGTTRNRLMRFNTDGTEDTAFYTNLGTSFAANVEAIALQTDGKILAAGTFTSFNGNTRNRLVRLNTDGTEDTAFYTNLGTGFDGGIVSVILQSDGKILVGGLFTAFNGTTRNRLVRLNSDGTEDTGFYTNLGTGFADIVWGVALQADGKILVHGQFTAFDGNTRNRLVRLNNDGTEDTGFYTNLGTGFQNIVWTTAVQSDGRILVGGFFTSLNGNIRFRLVRLNIDGTEDTAFYTNLGTSFNNDVRPVVLQPDGKILVGGQFNQLNGATYGGFVRLDSRGIADIASIPAATYAVGAPDIINLFNSSTSTGFNNTVNAVALESDDKILVGGGFITFNGTSRTRLMRLNLDGTEDTAFNDNLGTGFDNSVFAIAPQSDGKILAGGQFTTFNGNTRGRLVRLNADGTEDTAFYANLGTGFGSSNILNIALQSDGKILVGGGFPTLNGNTRGRLVRLNADGTEDTDFSTNLGTGFNTTVQGLAVQSDGKILVGGGFTTLDGTTRNRFVRLNSDGTVDTDFYTNLGTGFGGSITIVTLQSDGKILVGGPFTTLNGITRNRFVRLNSDGTVDTGFYANLGTGFDNPVTDIAIQPDDKIVVSGSFNLLNGNTRAYLTRLNLDGTEDTEFYTNLGTGFNGTTYVTLQSDGKILVNGSFTVLNGETRRILVRLDADGTLFTGSDNVDEGSSLTFTATTANVRNGSVLRWRIIDSPDDFAVSDGTVTINNNLGTFTLIPLEDLITEGPETFRIEISKLTGTVLATSSAVTINDTSAANLTLTPRALTIDEGDTVTIDVTVDSQNLVDGTVLYWTASSASDFSVSSGSFVINSDAGTFDVTPALDLTTEGTETFTVSVRTFSTSGTVIATSAPITINDTSVEIYEVSPAANTVIEGSTLAFTVTTQGVPDGTTLYWTVTNAGDFGTASGSFTVSSNTGSFSVTPSIDGTEEGSETFTASVRTGSTSGTVVATSSSVTITDLDNSARALTTTVAQNGEQFGWAVAISGNNVLIGAPANDIDGSSSGQAYIYNYTTGQKIHTLDNPNGTSSDNFGFTVAMNDSYALIAAYGRATEANLEGIVHVFSPSTGELLRTIQNPNTGTRTEINDTFGISPTLPGRQIAVHGDRAAIGAVYEDTATSFTAGVVHVFDLTNGNRLFTLENPSGTQTGDFYGKAVAISQNYILVGAYGEDDVDANNDNLGAAYLYATSNGALLRTFANPNNPVGNQDLFGNDVAVTDNYAAVAAYQEDPGAGNAGAVYVFNPANGNLLYTVTNPNPELNAFFGHSIAITDTHLIVGTPGENSNHGAAYIFDITDGTLIRSIPHPDPTPSGVNGDRFGTSVSISGTRAAVGSYGDDVGIYTSQGRVFVFDVRPSV